MLESQKVQDNLRASSAQHSRVASDLKDHQQLVMSLKEENERMRREIQSSAIGLQERIGGLTRENDELKRRLGEFAEIHRRLNEQEGNVVKLSQENEKLIAIIDQRNREIAQLQPRISEAELLARNYRDLQERLNKLAADNSALTNEYHTLQNTASQANRLGQENDRLKRRVVELETAAVKLGEYENKLATLTKEIERLNMVLKTKIDENGNFHRAVSELTEENRKVKIRLEQSSTWEIRFKEVQAERDGLARNTQELQRQLQDFSGTTLRLSEF